MAQKPINVSTTPIVISNATSPVDGVSFAVAGVPVLEDNRVYDINLFVDRAKLNSLLKRYYATYADQDACHVRSVGEILRTFF